MDCFLDLPPTTFLTLSGSLGAFRPNPLTKSWDFIFYSLLGIFHYVWAKPQENREEKKAKKKSRGHLTHTCGTTTLLVRDMDSPLRILSACSATLAVTVAAITTMVCLGLEVEEREKRKWGFTNLLEESLSAPQTCIEGSKKSSFSSRLMSISGFGRL